MIIIDNLLFEFAADDEPFAHSLYADWDCFCRDCFEKVVEECLAAYDKNQVLHEIALTELDLGSIPQEDFYREFPRRLKEELLKALPSWNLRTANETTESGASRLESLLFYLEHGYLQMLWADHDFNLAEELDWAVSQSVLYTEEIATLCLKKEYIVRRLLWQAGDAKALLRLYATALSQSSAGLHAKRCLMKLFLEIRPDIPVHYVHEVADDGGLHDMAELLDTMSVHRIMEKETEEHAEVDLPPYWHYLYEWIVRYYPFNGLAVFGGKGDFIRHLHYRLLTFVRKRNYSFYLSKAELTVSFLLEVFGASYYKTMLNAIYDLQPHHTDGSPMYDGYLNRELYHVFLQLSLLQLPAYPTDATALTEYLKDSRRSMADKRILLLLLAKEKPEILKGWLQTEAFKGKALVDAVIEMTDHSIIDHLLASVSLMAMDVAEQDIVNLGRRKIKVDVRKLQQILKDNTLSEAVKRRVAVLFLEQFAGSYENGVLLLHAQGLLEDVLTLISQPVYEEIIRQSVARMGGRCKVTELPSLFYWLIAHESTVSVFLQDKTIGLKVQILVWLAKSCQSQAGAGKAETDILQSFLAILFGKGNMQSAVEQIIRKVIGKTASETVEDSDMEAVLHLLLNTTIYTSRSIPFDLKEWLQLSEYDSNTIQALLKSCWNTDEGFTGWLEDTAITTDTKRRLLQRMVQEKPFEWITLLRRQSDKNKIVTLATPYLPTSRLLQSMVKANFRQAAILSQTIEWLQRKAGEFTFLIGYNISLSTALTKALLLFMQDKETLGGRTLTEQEAVNKFLFHLHFIYTGNTHIQSDAAWTDLSGEIAANLKIDGWEEMQKDKMGDEVDVDSALMKRVDKEGVLLPVESLADSTLPGNIRKRLLHGYIRFQPKALLNYIRQSVVRNTLPLDTWLEWMDAGDWIRLVASLSLSQADLLRQIMEYVWQNYSVKKEELQTALAGCILKNHPDEWAYSSKEETVRLFVKATPGLSTKTEGLQEHLIQKHFLIENIMKTLNLSEEENLQRTNEQVQAPEVIIIGNAGLCLLSPWFSRLFLMLGYLDQKKRDFKDTESRIRAVFVLQYWVYLEEKEYHESELAFNRLLVALPPNTPLPRSLVLTDEEKEQANSLMQAVKSHWSKMDGTTVKGLCRAFIERNGRLEQQDQKWLLTVDDRPFDVLLDSVPWGFRQIRFPWLKKYVQVSWHEKQAF